MPSTERPLAAWKSRTACSVAAPKSPSALPVRYPRSFSRRWRRLTSLPVEPILSVLLPEEVLEGVAVALGALVGAVVGGSVAVPICGALVAPLMGALVGLTLLGGLVAVSLPKSHALQSTSLLVGAGVGVGVTLGVGVTTVSKVCPPSPTVSPLLLSTTRSGSI